MKITWQDQTLSLTFQHNQNPRSTTATLRDIIGTKDGKPVYKDIATATVVKSHKDTDCKFEARKFALTKLLRKNLCTREQRTAVWKQYLSTVSFPK